MRRWKEEEANFRQTRERQKQRKKRVINSSHRPPFSDCFLRTHTHTHQRENWKNLKEKGGIFLDLIISHHFPFRTQKGVALQSLVLIRGDKGENAVISRVSRTIRNSARKKEQINLINIFAVFRGTFSLCVVCDMKGEKG